MAGKKKPDARSFSVRRHGHTDLFGVFLASHAVPDSFCLLHTGVGCKTKGQQHLVNHDWLRESFSRMAWSEISDPEVIMGAEDRLVQAMRDWIGRRDPSVMALATAAFVELRGKDAASAVERLKAETSCTLLHLSTPGYDGDLFRGYGAYTHGLMQSLDWDGGRPQGDLVNVAGYLFDRYEMDHRANLSELRHLLAGLGLKLHRVFLSGAPYTSLAEAPQASIMVRLPWLASPPAAVNRTWVDTNLPLGLMATRRWLERVGSCAGVKRDLIEKFTREQLEKVIPVLKPVVPRLAGLRAAVFSDTPRAAAITAYLVELGLEPVLVGLTDRTLGGRSAFDRVLGEQEVEAPLSMRMLEDPAPGEIEAALADLSGVDILIGSSHELGDLGHVKAGRIEIGFPSYEKHSLYPVPELGFSGALAFVQRLVDALAHVH
jgi:nitrogenase molybdenum-iron protein alpha/beta subunit